MREAWRLFCCNLLEIVLFPLQLPHYVEFEKTFSLFWWNVTRAEFWGVPSTSRIILFLYVQIIWSGISRKSKCFLSAFLFFLFQRKQFSIFTFDFRYLWENDFIFIFQFRKNLKNLVCVKIDSVINLINICGLLILEFSLLTLTLVNEYLSVHMVKSIVASQFLKSVCSNEIFSWTFSPRPDLQKNKTLNGHNLCVSYSFYWLIDWYLLKMVSLLTNSFIWVVWLVFNYYYFSTLALIAPDKISRFKYTSVLSIFQ